MNILSRLHGKSVGFIGRLLTTTTCMWLLGVALTPALAATPVVDQAPLIIQKPLPPNIVLMLDDSGSMRWDIMPDYGSLSDTSKEALVNSDVNGVYYNPTVTYTPPLMADGKTSYPQTDFSTASVNGFVASGNTVDLSTYRGGYDSFATGFVGTPVAYSVSVADAGASAYSPSSLCPANTSLSGGAQPGYCAFSDKSSVPAVPFNFFDGNNGYFYVSRCNSINDVYTDSTTGGTCTPGHSFFTYTTAKAGGGYTQHYVAKTAGDCAKAGLSSDVCDERVVTRQNVANWFSYYHTRILMAKSGLMNAFATIDPTFRVGFGSINNKNISGITSTGSYTNSYNGKYIARVQPFGNGSSGTQKSNFWGWVAGISPNDTTPLRLALDAVGKYYQTAQPWQTGGTGSDATTELACRQSYTILTTDGFWNGADPKDVGDVDGTPKSPITGPNNQPYTYTPVAPYLDGYSNTLADVAMKYWVTDLRTTVTNEVPTNKDDPAFWQHMVTFTLGLGFAPVGILPTGTTVDNIFTWANAGSGTPSDFSWPQPSSANNGSINNIADLAHAAVNGHGGFASAKSPQEFSQALITALKRASDRVGTGASLAANSTQLKTGAFAYQANYYTGNWKGDLKAIKVDPNNGMLALTPTWTAASALPAAGSRNIYTYNPTVSPVAAVPFNATTGLSTAEQTALGSDATAQLNMINYLRGDGTLEQKNAGGSYRTRQTPLGDIVNSQPVYSGQPEANQFVGQLFTGSDTYLTYAATVRQGLIFVAANDGMLHAFNADTGAEVYAYLPAAVITTNTSTTRTTGDLTTLSDPDYGTTASVPHQFFNDGELTVADVYFDSAWHTVAVGTTGRGPAKAVYALDVTDPTNIKLLWERSAGDLKTGADSIGQMTGKPVIAQTSDAVWSVLIGNGYNSKNGTAALLQFKISDGTLSVHPTDATTDNGLAAPGVWLGDLSKGVSTVAYAGDVKGGVWSFSLSTSNSSGTKLYTAKDKDGKVQPITAGMLVGKDPDPAAQGNLWVFFGTGQYLNSSDLTNTSTQSWYGLIVSSTIKFKGNNIAVTPTSDRISALVQRSIIAETPGTAEALNADGSVKTSAIAPARAVTALPDPSDMAGKSGWYIDLLSPTSTTASDGTVAYTANQVAEGERIVTPNQFQGNRLLATTRIPQAVDLCNPSGRGWIMAVDPFTGTNPKLSFFDLNGDGMINQPADYIMVNGKPMATGGIGFSSLPNNPIFIGGSMLVSFDNGSATSIKTSGTSNTLQRVSWRELIAQ
ncbi:MAG TPA: PilC/PilY family type IV pilus protein [Rhodanobacter sp.]